MVEVLHQRIARKHAARGPHQHLQNIEFEGGQLDRGPAGEDLSRARVERHAVHFQPARGRRGARFIAPQYGPDARRQFARVERLGQVVVGAQLQTHDAVHIVAARRQHHHRHVALAAQPAQDFEAIDARQHDIQHHQVDARFPRLFQSLLAFVFAVHREPFALQELTQQRAELRVVVDQ